MKKLFIFAIIILLFSCTNTKKEKIKFLKNYIKDVELSMEIQKAQYKYAISSENIGKIPIDYDGDTLNSEEINKWLILGQKTLKMRKMN